MRPSTVEMSEALIVRGGENPAKNLDQAGRCTQREHGRGYVLLQKVSRQITKSMWFTVDAESVDAFKTTRLDKHWSDRPLLYDFKAEKAGT